ncbi:MAG: two-component response regulator [Sphingomonas bacterium]|uniref:LytR/AlgR family response regulator transcription factor n=1 Tax=Sphingomonas bacterium TaxID=1895847 RepID=UPI0026175132|nr:LytTR family DNA-binding domain-containing protein [Sphingomonas bacterium]MDB5709537.1 two-component response regulator [Sphingomonas bacterium]
MAFTAIIMDDEPLAVEALRGLCARSSAVNVIGDAGDGGAGLAAIDRLRPDAVFLDIEMPGMDGLSVAARLGRLAAPPLIVFVTAYDHFAAQAFDLAVIDYVLKPVEAARLDRAIERVAERLALGRVAEPARAREFWVPSRGAMVRVNVSDIKRVEAERDYVRIFAWDASYLLRGSITAIEERLDPEQFLRVHRSTILRRSAIAQVRHRGAGAWVATDMAGGSTNIGRSFLANVRAKLGMSGP